MGAAISQYVSEYYALFLEDPLQYGAPIVFLASVALLLVLVVRRIIDDRRWAPQRHRKRDAMTGRKYTKYKEVSGHRHVHYPGWANLSARELVRRSGSFYALMNLRRSVRMFSDKPVPRSVIENCIRTAGTAPSGAHQQPWRFVVIEDPQMKHELRMAAEAEEEVNYSGRMNDQWLNALAPIGTSADKSYYDKVPYIIVIFKITHTYNQETGEKQPHYYFERSVGIAAGMLITAIHEAGLCTLTHTPTPMGFLTKMLDRPSNEKPYLMLPVGYAADDCYVPDLQRKPLEDIVVWR